MRPGLVALAAVAVVSVAGCDPHRKNGASVRATLDVQARGSEAPREIGLQAQKAQASLKGWRTDTALTLSTAVSDTQRELELTARLTEPSSLHLAQSLEVFREATEIVAAAASPMDAETMASVVSLLEKSRDLALTARNDTPSAVSPVNSLKTLRKHQSSGAQYQFPE